MTGRCGSWSGVRCTGGMSTLTRRPRFSGLGLLTSCSLAPPSKRRRSPGSTFAYDDDSGRLAAAVAVLDVASLERVEEVVVIDRVRFGYEPGRFAFRELPTLLEALGRLRSRPDLLVCDSHGYAHPERFGLACHAGLWTGIPSIGCAKTPFVGTPRPIGRERAERAAMVDDGEVVGFALRTRAGVKPVYVSPGHLIGFDEAVAWVLRLAPRYRVPEPIRAADHLARQALGR